MWNWFIVVVKDQSAEENGSTVTKKIIEKIFQSGTLEDEVQSDYVFTSLDHAQTTFYSFANMTLADVGLGEINEGDELPDGFDDKTFAVYGNVDRTDVEAGSYHIPMSNKQEFTIDASTSVVRLEVVRMLVKVEIQVNNPSESDIVLNSITLRSVTQDGYDSEGNNNLMLLPGSVEGNASDESYNGARNTNINASYTTASVDRTINVNESVTSNGGSKSVVFYINESVAPEDLVHFALVLNTTQGENTTDRSAILDWSSMARNEYHILPVYLDRYSIKFTVQGFSAIGVLPWIDGDDVLPTIHTYYGRAHIYPYVVDLVTGNKVSVKWRTYAYPESAFLFNSNRSRLYGIYLPIKESGGDDSGQIGSSMSVYYQNYYNAVSQRPDTDPEYPGEYLIDDSKRRLTIEFKAGNYDVWAIYTLYAEITDSSGKAFNISKDFMAKVEYINFDDFDW